MKNLGMIGFGNLGQAFIKGIIRTGKISPDSVFVTAKTAKTLELAQRQFKVNACEAIADVVSGCDEIIIAVKPNTANEVIKGINTCSTKGKIFISFMAGLPLDALRSRINGDALVVRAMPNLAIMNGSGFIGLAMADNLDEHQRMSVKGILSSVGMLVEMDEVYLDKITALSACGLAFVAAAIESFIDAGVKIGIPRDISTRISVQTFLGAARTIHDENIHPVVLKNSVATPGGATVEGLTQLEKSSMRVSFIAAIESSFRRTLDLSGRE